MNPDSARPVTKIRPLLAEDFVLCNLGAEDRDGALREIAAFLGARIPGLTADAIFESLLGREKLGSTAVGGGFAIPHSQVAGLEAPRIGLALSPRGVAFESLDGRPTHVFFVILGSPERPAQNLQLLAAVASLIRMGGRLAAVLPQARTPRQVLDGLAREEEGRK